MRKAFVDALVSHSEIDDSLFLIVGDLGFGVVEGFSERFPERFLNAGVAEQSMVSVAAGLARTGRHVFVYSIANFATFRALEQIRNDIAYHRLSVTIVSVGAGLGYGTLGYTHHAVEDIAVVGAIPNMKIYSPADAFEVDACVDMIVSRREPSYLRLGKGGESPIHDAKPNGIEEGLQLLGKRGRILVLSTGEITANVLEAWNSLREGHGDDFVITSVPTLTREALQLAARGSYDAIVTVEEHSVRGGLGSLVSDIFAPQSGGPPIFCIGIENPQKAIVGSQNFLRESHGLSPELLAEKLKSVRHAIY